LFRGHLFHPHQHLAIAQILPHGDAQVQVFGVGITAHRAGLHHNFYFGKSCQRLLTFEGRQGHPFIGRLTSFPDDADFYFFHTRRFARQHREGFKLKLSFLP
jgi:hypothetical protein